MSVTFETTKFKGRMNAFYGEPKILPGGFNLKQTFQPETLIKRGALVRVDFETMSAAIVKYGKVIKGGNTGAPRVSKDSYFQAGDTIMVLGGKAAATVQSVDDSNDDFDVLTLSGALTGATEGAFLLEGVVGTDEAKTVSAAYGAPNMILGADRDIVKSQLATLDVAYSGLVLKDVIPEMPSEWLMEDSPCLKTNPNIMFIKQ